MRIAYGLSPWIKFEGRQDIDKMFNQLRSATRKYGGALLMTNHSSFMDAFVTSAILPYDIAYRTRSLVKSSLLKIPIVGECFRLCGFFPVYFTDNVKFSVNREKQAKVTAETKKFLQNGGVMLFCPEGQVERETPHKIQKLRRGSFSLSAMYNLPIFTNVMMGNYEVWPVTWKLGGLPGTINFKSRCAVSPADLWSRDCTSNEEDIKARAAELADMTRVSMQQDVDYIFESTGRRAQFGVEYARRLEQREKQLQLEGK